MPTEPWSRRQNLCGIAAAPRLCFHRDTYRSDQETGANRPSIILRARLRDRRLGNDRHYTPMPRSPLFLVGLVLFAAAAAMLALHNTPPPPQVRPRSETVRTDPGNRGGLDPAVAPISAPPSALPGSGHGTSEGSVDSVAAIDTGPPSLQRIVAARCIRSGQPVAAMEFVLVPKSGKGRWQSVRTDENGSFRRALPTEGEWELRAIGDDLSVHQRTWTLQIQNGRPLELGDIELRPRVRIAGRAIDANGAPLADARVTTFITDDRTAPRVCTTTGNGEFVLEDVPSGQLRLEASRGSLQARIRLDIDDHANTVPLALTLRSRAIARWTLRDDDGRAVAGAVVEDADPARTAIEPTGTSDELGVVEIESSLGARLCVRRDGWLPLVLAVDGIDIERKVVLRRLREVNGTLGETGAGAQIHVGTVAGQGAPHALVRGALERVITARDDGTFAIQGLVAGRYTVRATTKSGATVLREFSLPEDTLLSLQPVPGRVRTIDIRDERGEAVPFASAMVRRDVVPTGDATAAARALLALPFDGPIWRADYRGRIDCAVSDEAMGIVVTMKGHLPVAAALAGEPDAPVVIAIPRATVLDGQLTEVSSDRPHDLRVVAWLHGDDARTAIELPLDESLAFRSEDLRPGRWNVAVVRRDRTVRGPMNGATTNDLPLLGDGLDTRTTTTVDARGGAHSQLLLPVPELGRIDGEVRQGGRPVAGVTVFATVVGAPLPSALESSPLGYDDVTAARAFPRTTTDANGRFTMLVARPGQFVLRARAEGQPFTSPPVEVRLASYGDQQRPTIELPRALVRGTFAMTPEPGSAGVRAYLLPLADAARNPFAADARGQADAEARLALAIAADGAFLFQAVPRGDYVIRFVRGMTQIVRQRFVRVADGPVDLETLTPAPIAPSVRIPLGQALAHRVTAHLLQELVDAPNGAFCASIDVVSDLELSGLAPGRYRVVFLNGLAPLGVAQTLELHGNGTAVPGVLVIAP
jgi:hypothetical protein